MAEEKFNSGTPRTYYKTKKEDGKNFSLWKYSKVSENNPHEIQVTSKNGDIGYNIPVMAISGNLLDVKMRKNEYDGKKYSSWEFVLSDVNEHGEPTEMVLTCSYGSKYANHIISALPNCNLKMPIRLMPYAMAIEGTDKYNTGTSVYQGKDEKGKHIKIARHFDMLKDEKGSYVKDAQGKYQGINGLPAPISRRVEGEIKLDFTDQNSFLEEYVIDKLRAELLSINTQDVQSFAPSPLVPQAQHTQQVQSTMKQVPMNANSFDNVPLPTEFVATDIDDLPF